jgi:hypothetical protein
MTNIIFQKKLSHSCKYRLRARIDSQNILWLHSFTPVKFLQQVSGEPITSIRRTTSLSHLWLHGVNHREVTSKQLVISLNSHKHDEHWFQTAALKTAQLIQPQCCHWRFLTVSSAELDKIVWNKFEETMSSYLIWEEQVFFRYFPIHTLVIEKICGNVMSSAQVWGWAS